MGPSRRTAQDELADAVAARDPDGVRRALAAGADAGLRAADDWNALDRAAGLGDTSVVATLLEHGADPTATGPDLRTPYQIALAAGRREAAEMLRAAEERADPSAADRHVWRPYCRAYLLGEIRRFATWAEPDPGPGEDALTDDAVVFVHDDLAVTRSMWRDTGVLADGTAEGWATFCAEQLGFRVPDDFDLMPSD
jgi:uncharacterized protein